MARDKKRLYPIKKLVPLTAKMAERISDYRFKHRIASENEAVRQLIAAGLSVTQSSPTFAQNQLGKALSELRDIVREAAAPAAAKKDDRERDD